MYHKSQIFYTLASFCVFTYAIFHYIRYKAVESYSSFEVVPIVNTSCRNSTRSASGIKVSRNNKEYSVELPYDTCNKYSIGDKVSLLYDEKYNRFYLPNYFRVYRFRAIFTTIIFVLVILPWKGIVSSVFKRKSRGSRTELV